jgi:hypothetical protein
MKGETELLREQRSPVSSSQASTATDTDTQTHTQTDRHTHRHTDITHMLYIPSVSMIERAQVRGSSLISQECTRLSATPHPPLSLHTHACADSLSPPTPLSLCTRTRVGVCMCVSVQGKEGGERGGETWLRIAGVHDLRGTTGPINTSRRCLGSRKT